jgi:glycine reductase
MLLRKLDGLPVESEIPFHATVSGRCAPPIRNLAEASIALVTESGFVPQGNPDRLPGLRSQRHFVYPIHHLDRFEPGDYESIHSGYDKTDANNDPNRLVPLDALRELERLQAIRSVHGQLYTTAGCATYLEKAQQMAQRIAADLKRHEVDGVVLTST